MPEVALEPRRSILTPARVLVGSLIAGAGLTVLGFLAGGPAASAAEPAPPPSPVTALVSNVTGGVGDVVGSVTQTVAPALPHHVQSAVSAVVTPVTSAVDHVVEQAPVGAVVQPVAAAVDQVVAAVPVLRGVLPAAPVTSVTQPVTSTVDQTVSEAVGAVDTAVAPITTPGGVQAVPQPGETGADGGSTVLGAAIAGLLPVASVVGRATLPVCDYSASSGGVDVVPGAFTSGAGSVPLGDPAAPGAPGGPSGGAPGGTVPGGTVPGGNGGMTGGGSGPGAAAPTLIATSDDFFLPGSARTGLTGGAADDHVPAGPVADHDISPD
ncbi:hypothetical protein [Leifsonia sp. SIMBA_070]|uniref:hypothetical protein n=1 Tax=Leifsonia sp. SIMBA_070 TaxID=3085810 RepID=UPI00397DF802